MARRAAASGAQKQRVAHVKGVHQENEDHVLAAEHRENDQYNRRVHGGAAAQPRCAMVSMHPCRGLAIRRQLFALRPLTRCW